MSRTPLSPRPFGRLQEGAPTGFILLMALLNTQDAAKSVLIHANRHQHGDITTSPAQLRFEHNAIEVDIRILASMGGDSARPRYACKPFC